MNLSALKPRLPGYIATGLLIIATSLWTFWGMGEMYYEGWGLPFPTPLRYLIPPAICMALTLVVLTWPSLGGWLIVSVGAIFTIWWWMAAAEQGWLDWKWVLTTSPVSLILILTGVLFLFEGRRKRKLRQEGWTPPKSWVGRNLRYIVAVVVPLIVAIGVLAFYVPYVLSRVDDGNRGMRLIEGNGVTLIWAPQGPGWNWKQDWGGYPSWDHLALYGAEPVGFGEKLGYKGKHAKKEDMMVTGLCRYLSEDGKTLMDEPQDIWRMPTTEEIVRSLVSGGQNAGCRWDGKSGSATCQKQPNKGTPLWASDQEAIYYWSRDQYNQQEAWYVPYTGGGRYGGQIGHQPKDWGNPRHGYRCVKEP